MFAKKPQLNNDSIWSTDFSAESRRKAIARIPAMRVRTPRVAGAETVGRGVWMTDVSGMDSRSVKHWLRGGFSARILWWKVASAVLMRWHGGSMEHSMYDFHRMHHGVTILLIEFASDYKAIVLWVTGHLAPSRI